MPNLANFIHPGQLSVINDLMHGEEKEFFIAKIEELTNLITTMPKTYEQEGSDDPVVYLHYFYGGCDWWITERDMEEEQLQAFGYASINQHSPEAGYISLKELMSLRHVIEIDLHFTPQPISKISRLSHFAKG